MKCRIWAFAFSCVIGCSQSGARDGVSLAAAAAASAPTDPFSDATGTVQTFYASGTSIDTSGAFFQAIAGSNGRSCVSCHVPGSGWTITPSELNARFTATQGLDPVFLPVDGSTSPTADVSTLAARQSAYGMLLSKGLIRVGKGIPANAEFTLTQVDDPYGYASANELSLFRRPLPSTNVLFLSTVMWDGRETVKGQSIDADLLQQANDATAGHAQVVVAAPLTPLTATQARQIVDLEEALFTAQTIDNGAGNLTAKHGLGGPQQLANQPFHLGINDVLGNDPVTTDPPFTPVVFNEYDAWSGATGGGTDGARASVARGQAIFNTRPISISGVGGLNDVIGDPLSGTCTTCHDTPNVGDHSLPAPLNIGIADGSRRTPDLPLYTLTNNSTKQVTTTTDPGRALVTGKWADIGKFKGPILRGLAARPPYFHNGSAAALDDVVNFYNARFALGLSAQEHADLVAFLQTL
jgi:cytochrome c peroxidase